MVGTLVTSLKVQDEGGSAKVSQKLFRAQRALAAFLAISLRRRADSLLARATPPFSPPRRPNSTARGSLAGFRVCLDESVSRRGSETVRSANWLELALEWCDVLDRFGMPSAYHNVGAQASREEYECHFESSSSPWFTVAVTASRRLPGARA
jgi:hypothetical protein